MVVAEHLVHVYNNFFQLTCSVSQKQNVGITVHFFVFSSA